jgi:hypothetical protein
MVASYVRERERIFLRWLENVERLLGRHVDPEAAYKAWRDGYTVREFAGELTSPPAVKREAEEDWGRERQR